MTHITLAQSLKPKKHLSFTAMRRALSDCFHAIDDKRMQGKTIYSLHDILMSAFACMYLQSPSILAYQRALEEHTHRNNLKSLFNVTAIPEDTQLRDVIDTVDSEHLRPIFRTLHGRLQRGKYLSQYRYLEGYHVCSLDGTQYHHSQQIHCAHCLTKTSQRGQVTYSHQVLQAALMHPDCRQVLPLMPEAIINTDGTGKQDCEINAAKRLLPKIRQDHPQLKVLMVGDGLYSHAPMIKALRAQNMRFVLVAKPKDHVYLMAWLSAYPTLENSAIIDKKGRRHQYQWKDQVPLHGGDDAPIVNYFDYERQVPDSQGEYTTTYRNSWVTDMTITDSSVDKLVKAGRCRWKIENECFNTLKNHGYEITHNYGHGQQHLCHNFFVLTLLAFTFHQISELTDKLFQACRAKCGSRRDLWGKIRAYLERIIFTSWELLLEVISQHDAFEVTLTRRAQPP